MTNPAAQIQKKVSVKEISLFPCSIFFNFQMIYWDDCWCYGYIHTPESELVFKERVQALHVHVRPGLVRLVRSLSACEVVAMTCAPYWTCVLCETCHRMTRIGQQQKRIANATIVILVKASGLA